MQSIIIELNENEAIPRQDQAVYMEPGSEFLITVANVLEEDEELFYINRGIKIPIIGNQFKMKYEDLKDSIYLQFIKRRKGEKESQIYTMSGLPVHNFKIVGRQILGSHPQIMAFYNNEILEIKKMLVRLYETSVTQAEYIKQLEERLNEGELM